MFHSRPLAHADSTLVDFNDSFRFALAYDWMIGSMIARGLSRPHPEVYPIWAFYRWYGTTMPKPDLRCVGMKDWGHRQRLALLTLEITDEGVLLSDYCRWYSCLNYQYAGTVKASEAFERRCNRHHPKPSYSEPLPAPLHQELVASWDLVLDIETSRRMFRKPTATHIIQATFWEVTAQQVVAAVAFGDGRPVARLPLPGRRPRRSGHQAKGRVAERRSPLSARRWPRIEGCGLGQPLTQFLPQADGGHHHGIGAQGEKPVAQLLGVGDLDP